MALPAITGKVIHLHLLTLLKYLKRQILCSALLMHVKVRQEKSVTFIENYVQTLLSVLA